MIGWRFLITALLALGLAACDPVAPRAVGQLTSDRVELTAEFGEPIIAIEILEGDSVTRGQTLVTQNSERVSARMAELEASIGRIDAQLAEQLAGPRPETIDAARARVEELAISLEFRTRELARLTRLREQSLTSEESVDLARMLMQTTQAGLEASRAQLQELEAGTRQEQIQQTRQSLEQANAQLAQLRIEQARHVLTAPVDGVVDSLPFEMGERPAAGQVVVVLLTGQQPHARVYVPEPVRVTVQPGDAVQVRVDGLAGDFTGTVRRIASEATFTPYFALTETDRGRLSYVAEISLPALEERLPDGVPVEAWFEGMEIPENE